MHGVLLVVGQFENELALLDVALSTVERLVQNTAGDANCDDALRLASSIQVTSHCFYWHGSMPATRVYCIVRLLLFFASTVAAFCVRYSMECAGGLN